MLVKITVVCSVAFCLIKNGFVPVSLKELFLLGSFDLALTSIASFYHVVATSMPVFAFVAPMATNMLNLISTLASIRTTGTAGI